MKSKTLKLALFVLTFFLLNHTTLTAFEKQSIGVVFRIQQEKSIDVKLLKIQICSDEIIRVIASPVDSFSSRASLMVEKNSWSAIEWTVRQDGKWIVISTKANGEDLSFVTVKVLDKDGNLVPYADNLVQFKLEGEGKIAGVDNGCQTSMESFKANHRKAFNGLCLVVVQSSKNKGNINIKASSEGLQEAVIDIQTQ